jgi:class 3 adenylate cyclase/pimeloyl-ACP methyl ester carboxylesterase
MNPSIKFVKREDGVKIAYSTFGNGQPLVVPAPWVTSLSSFFDDPILNQFWGRLSQEVMVILYDKHGCGQSDRNRKEFTIEAELLDLETVIDHLGLEQFNLFGSSMAGPVSLAYTERNPKKVTHLILYGAYASGKNLAKKEVRSALISLVRASWGLGSKALADIFHPEANTEELQSLAKFQRDSASPEITAKLLELCFSLDVSKLLSSINIPTLILHRDGDKVVTIDHGRQLAVEIPNAQFKLLKGAIHPCWYGESDDIIAEIHEFIYGEEPLASESIESETSIEKDLSIDKLTFSIEESEFGEQVTIVFSDIVSSTDLVVRLGDAAARDIFLQHDKIVRDQIKKYGGRELQNLGDGFMLSFESASAAIKCACSIQKKISQNIASIKVRIGINTGEVVMREGRHPFGQAVVVASRIVSRAKGEQILVSDVTKHLTAGSGFSFVERGRFKPKGFSESMKLYEVSWKE